LKEVGLGIAVYPSELFPPLLFAVLMVLVDNHLSDVVSSVGIIFTQLHCPLSVIWQGRGRGDPRAVW